MKIDLYQNDDCFKFLDSEWNVLLSQSRSNTIFLTKEWQEIWWKFFGGGNDLYLLTLRDDDGSLVGIAPLYILMPDGEKTALKFIGENDISDYLDFIVAKGREHEVYGETLEFLADSHLPWEELELYPLPSLSITPKVFGHFFRELGYDVTLNKADVCPFVDLPSNRDDYLNLLGKKDRHELRRKIRRAEMEYNMSIDQLRDSSGLEGGINSFFNLLERSNDPGKAGFLSRDGMKGFFQEMARVSLKNDWIGLYFLRIDGIDVASMMCFHYNNTSFLYNSGYSPDYSSISPGIVLLYHCIQEAIRKGSGRFDFLRGEERYKYNFGAKPSHTFRMRIIR